MKNQGFLYETLDFFCFRIPIVSQFGIYSKKIRHISVGDRYAELSQRVNKNTNANIDLSADDYAEFLDINKRLAVCLISYDKESVNL